jgi:TRAP-type C4-dicarboxylate transport system substrate-binding protein
MKLGTATLNDGQHEFLKRFAEDVGKRSGGRIKGEVYPASQLGPIPREIEAVQLGAIQGFIAPAEFFEGVDSRFQVLTAPGLFQDMDHVDRVVKDPAFREAFYQLGRARGLTVGNVFLSGPTAINSRSPVAKIDDLKNLKLRVMASPMQTNPIKTLGASPVPIPLGDVLPALQQGTIDGVVSVLPVLASLHYFDAAKYITETNFSMTVSCFTLSSEWLSKLPPELQKDVLDSARDIGDQMHPWVVAFYETQKQAWVKGGGQVLDIPSQQRAQTMERLSQIAHDVVESDKTIQPIYKIVSDAAQRTRK